jgi:hypothetical protein
MVPLSRLNEVIAERNTLRESRQQDAMQMAGSYLAELAETDPHIRARLYGNPVGEGKSEAGANVNGNGAAATEEMPAWAKEIAGKVSTVEQKQMAQEVEEWRREQSATIVSEMGKHKVFESLGALESAAQDSILWRINKTRNPDVAQIVSEVGAEIEQDRKAAREPYSASKKEAQSKLPPGATSGNGGMPSNLGPRGKPVDYNDEKATKDRFAAYLRETAGLK